MLLSTFELLLKPQFPTDAPAGSDSEVSDVAKLSRTVIQGYFLTIANVNSFDVTVSLVFTVRFPNDTRHETPTSFKDIIDAIDISGQNFFGSLVPELGAENTKARLTFIIPANATSLLVVQPDFINNPQLLRDANFEARGYVEIFLSALSNSNCATLLVTAQQRGTFFKTLDADALADIGLDQVAYDLPVSNGGVFMLSNS